MGFLYLLPLSVGAPVDHVTLLSHKSAGSNVGPHNVFFFFFSEKSFKFLFCVLSFNIQVANFAAGNVGRCKLRKYTFSYGCNSHSFSWNGTLGVSLKMFVISSTVLMTSITFCLICSTLVKEEITFPFILFSTSQRLFLIF